MPLRTADNNFGTAKWIVSANFSDGCTHTTITSAIASAASGDTIFIRPGTYTENFSMKPGVNLSAYQCDAYNPNVIILGKITATFAGTCSISGIQLKTNSDFCLAVTGSSATIVNLKGCFVDANNSVAISFTSSSSSSKIQLYDCKGNIDTTGISYFTHSGAGALKFFGGTFENDGASTTAATSSGSGGLNLYNCYFSAPITTSSTSALSINNTQFQSPLIVNGTGTNFISNCAFVAGSSSAISVGTGATLTLGCTSINSANTNAITGAGILVYSGVTFSGTSSKINTTTQTGGVAQGGLTQAPSTGFIGESIRSQVGNTGITTATPSNLTSISLTAGIWDVSAVAQFTSGGNAGTKYQIGISTTSATFGTAGDSQVTNDFSANMVNNYGTFLPSFRITITATTTTYLVVQSNFTGTMQASGRISATRVG